MKKALAGFAAALAVASCGRSPMSPERPPAAAIPTAPATLANFAGVSVLTFREDICLGGRNCFATRGGTDSIELRLDQSGSEVTGLLLAGYMDAVAVTGRVSADGELTLTGSREPRNRGARSPGRTVRTLQVRRDAGGAVSGAVLLDADYSASEMGVITQGGAVLSFDTVQDLSAFSGFSGDWSGMYLTKSCTFTGAMTCHTAEAGDIEPFQMTLAAGASGVSGEIRLIGPVSGDTSGGALTLFGGGAVSTSSHTTIARSTLSRDKFGQLHGTIHYVIESPTRTSTYEIELYYVTQDNPQATALRK